MERETLLRVENVSKSFLGVKALDKVSLDVKKGEIHGVIGENGAGKSTLMNIIFGSLQRDEGEIVLQGQPVSFSSPADAIAAGISMIHQETRLVQQFTASENIWLGAEKLFSHHGFTDNKKRDAASRELLRSLGLELPSDKRVCDVSAAQMQLIEVARAVATKAKLIIMDEPTSSLSEREVAALFKIIRSLADQGVSIVFISHKIDEIIQICDRVSIYRDGKYIRTSDIADTSAEEIIRAVVGRELSGIFPKVEAEIGEPVLEVRGLTRQGVFENVSFCVRKGEILGFSGLAGAGRSEVMQAIFGIDPLDRGEIYVEGRKVVIKHPSDAVRLGFGMVTEDRLRKGIIAKFSVASNISIVRLRDFCTRFIHFIRGRQEKAKVDEVIRMMQIKTSSPEQQIDALSGGNQQKSIIGRWIMTNPKILILDEPTRGIDVGSKSEIHRLMGEFVKQGMAVILISSELPEVLGMADRIVVMREGRAVFECSRKDATQELIGKYALG